MCAGSIPVGGTPYELTLNPSPCSPDMPCYLSSSSSISKGLATKSSAPGANTMSLCELFGIEFCALFGIPEPTSIRSITRIFTAGLTNSFATRTLVKFQQRYQKSHRIFRNLLRESQKVGGQATLRSGSCVCDRGLNFGYQRRNTSSRSSLRTGNC